MTTTQRPTDPLHYIQPVEAREFVRAGLALVLLQAPLPERDGLHDSQWKVSAAFNAMRDRAKPLMVRINAHEAGLIVKRVTEAEKNPCLSEDCPILD